MNELIRILIVEDVSKDAELALRLEQAGLAFEWQRVETESDYCSALAAAPDVILCDYHLPGLDALRALSLLKERGLDIPLIVVTGSLGEELAVECIKQGAADYLLKDRLARLGSAVRRALSEKRLREESRQTQLALQEAEAKYRVLVEQSPIVVYMDGLDAPNPILYISPQVEALTGYSSEEWETTPNFWQRLVHPDDRQRTWAENIRTNATGEPFKMEYRLMARDGRIVWVRDEAVIIRDGAGRPRFWQGVMLDITERKHAEEALRLSEAKFSKAFHTSPALMAISAVEDGRYVDVNEAFLQALGYTKDEVVGRTSLEINLFADPGQREAAVKMMREQGNLRNLEAAIRVKDGSIRYGLFAADFVQLEYQRLLLTVMVDITERKQTEEALAQERNLLRTLIDNLPDHIFIKDTNRRYVLNNMAHLRSLGAATQDEVMGKTAFDFHPRELAEQYDADERQVIQTGQPLLGREERFLDQATGQEKWGLAIKMPLKDSRGQVVGLVGIGHNITERKQAEEALRRYADENVRLFKAEQRRAEQLALVGRVAQAVSAALSVSDVCRAIYEHVSEIVSCDAFVLSLFDAEAQTIRAVFSVQDGQVENVSEFPLLALEPPGQGTQSEVIRAGRGLIVPDLEEQLKGLRVYHIGTEGPTTRSAIYVPLQAQGRVVGVLQAQSYQLDAYRPEDLTLLEAVVGHAAAALVNVRLYEETRAHAEQLAWLYEAGLALNRVLDPRAQLETLFEIMIKALRADRAEFFRYDAARGELQLELGVGYGETVPDQLRHLRFRVGEERGVVGRVGSSRTLLYIPDVFSEPDWVVVDPEIRSGLWVPVEHESQLHGVLGVLSARVNAFTPQDQRLLTLFASQAAIALENARLFEAAQNRARRLATLNEIGRAVTSTLDLDGVLSALLEQVRQTTEAEACSVALIERETGDLVFRQAAGSSAQAEAASQTVMGFRLKPGEGIAGWVAANRKSVLVPDAASDPRFHGDVANQTGFITRSMVCVPLVAREAVIGVIQLINRQMGAFSAEDIELLEAVAAQAAIAIENARLFQAERAGRQRLETLYRIGQALNSTLDVGAIFDRLTDEAMRATGATHGSALVARLDLNCFERRSLRGYSPEAAGQARTLLLPLEDGLNGRAYHARQVMRVDDVRADPDYFPLVPETRSELVAPIVRGDQVLGNLDLQSPQVGAFRDIDLDFVQTLTDQVAIALENARLYQETRRRLNELSLVSYVALMGAAGRPFDETVALATNALSQLWPDANAMGFLFLDEAEQVLRVHPSYKSLLAEDAGIVIPIQEGLTGWATRERQPIRVGDVSADSRYFGSAGVRSEMAAPLVVGERIIGVINVESPRPDTFSGDDLRVLTTLAGQFATILEKARLDVALEVERASLARRVAERTAELSIANAELAKAARLKDEFLASMSHELRTPLNAILGMSEALQELVYGPLNEKQLKSLRTVEESGRHLLSLINDILDLSKIEAGKVELQIGPAAVGMICQASLQFIKQTALKKRIQVSLTLDSQVTTLQADERRLKQILVNLLSNAVKFTPEGGAVGLDVKGDAEKSVVRLTIWDTGIGIAPENMDKLFQPFVQLDSRLSRQYSGTGLGLSLVHRMVEMHGGSISVESEVGKGSRFTVSLPWAVNQEVNQPEEEMGRQRNKESEGRVVASSPDHPVTVLLADDNEISLGMVSEYLMVKGYRVIPARNGREVIQRAREDKPDIILMDIQMPGMDGLEAIRRIRSDAASKVAKIPIIALTALVMPGDRERCIEAGANEYIGKPVSPQGLVKVIQALRSKGD